MSKPLEQAIIKTIAYFDVFRYPLTELEAHKWLWGRKASFLEIQEVLEKLVHEKKISKKDGLFFLHKNEVYIPERRKKYIEVQTRYKKLRRFAKIIQIAPFVKFFGACNTLLILDFNEKSDIDVFIIAKKNRIWTTRLLVTALTAFTRQWRHGKNVKDKICLSFYVTEESLNLEHIAIENPDPYLVYWIQFVIPMINRDKTYQRFFWENEWIKEFTPQAKMYVSLKRRVLIAENKAVNQIRLFFEKILAGKTGDAIEKKLRDIQLNKIQKTESKKQNPKRDVIVSDTMLKFHEIDRRKEYKNQWLEKIKQLWG